MSIKYIKHNWESGDILFADQLNEIDNQIALNEENIQSKLGKDDISFGLHFDGKYYVLITAHDCLFIRKSDVIVRSK